VAGAAAAVPVGAGAAVVAGAGVAGAGVARTVAVGAVVVRPVPPERGGAAGPVLFAVRPVPDGVSGAVALGVAGCVGPACGTIGELTVGPPSRVLTSRAT
jgi:hypothetical protein